MSDMVQDSVLGSGRGLDHLAVATKDLETTIQQYHQTLGFAAPQRTKLPNGIENGIIWFADGTYLELFTIFDPEKAGFIAAVVGDNEGGMFYALDVSSAEGTITYLRAQGCEVTDPIGGTTAIAGMSDPPPELWRYVMFLKPITPANEVFFIEYHWDTLAALSEKYPEFNPAAGANHANTAQSLKSVWIAVEDVDTAVQAYTSMGLSAGPEITVPQIHAAGVTIEAAQSTILLLAATQPDGVTASFLAQRGAGPIGTSIEVADLQMAADLIAANDKPSLVPYDGSYGRSVLVPAERTTGIWLELFQKA